jgi:hypothetical protein
MFSMHRDLASSSSSTNLTTSPLRVLDGEDSGEISKKQRQAQQADEDNRQR